MKYGPHLNSALGTNVERPESIRLYRSAVKSLVVVVAAAIQGEMGRVEQ
jgi:hypothetical protein